LTIFRVLLDIFAASKPAPDSRTQAHGDKLIVLLGAMQQPTAVGHDPDGQADN
jgi:hypothetical protein